MVKLLQLVMVPALALRSRQVRQASDDNSNMFLEPDASPDPLERAKNQCFFVAKQLKHHAENDVFDLDWLSAGYAAKYDCKLRNYQDAVSDDDILSFLETVASGHICAPLIENMSEDDYRIKKKNKKRRRQENQAWQNVRAYGCYCSFGEEAMDYGRGTAVNQLDERCQYAHMNYQCLEEENPNCKALSRETYYISLETDASQGITTEEACHRYNQQLQDQNGWSDEDLDCVQKRCLIDSEFINDVIDISFSDDYNFNEDFIRPELGGTFQYQDECPESPGPLTNEMICCGKYPQRFTYHPQRYGCCEENGLSQSYRIDDQACCNDGSIARYGDPEFNDCAA